ncbi:hypothetical protein ACFE04_030188 [Oxalis oulophora]
MLSSSLTNLPRFTPLLWNHAQIRLCADGGANRLYDDLPHLSPFEEDVRTRYKPDMIIGDMDSIRPQVLNFYTSLGIKVLDDSTDQNTTDLHKCIAYIPASTPSLDKSNLCILVTGALAGRFDHEAGNINLLPKTFRHEIHIQPSVDIGMSSAITTTTGLEWNLVETEMKFGGLVSTSNLVKGEKLGKVAVPCFEVAIYNVYALNCYAIYYQRPQYSMPPPMIHNQYPPRSAPPASAPPPQARTVQPPPTASGASSSAASTPSESPEQRNLRRFIICRSHVGNVPIMRQPFRENFMLLVVVPLASMPAVVICCDSSLPGISTSATETL